MSGNSDSINYKKIASVSTASYGCILEKRLHRGIDYFIVGSEAGEELDEAERTGYYLLSELINLLCIAPQITAEKKEKAIIKNI